MRSVIVGTNVSCHVNFLLYSPCAVVEFFLGLVLGFPTLLAHA